MKSEVKSLSPEERQALLGLLKDRFERNMHRHREMKWPLIQEKLEAHPDKMWSLDKMEMTGGEPDVVGFDEQTGAYLFVDCAAESPNGRRNVCYDRAALDARKEHKPQDSALEMAADMGIELLTEDQYRSLQALEPFDTKTSSWILTPPAIRKRGGALFADRRYDHVFVYHNGAQSYYSARGFRGVLRVR